jgi:hypothetical protein
LITQSRSFPIIDSFLWVSREAVGAKYELERVPEDSADLILATANGILERRSAISRDVDAKLSSLLGFVAGGTGIAGIVTASGHEVTLTPLLVSAACSLLLTLLSCLEGIFPNPRRRVEIRLFDALKSVGQGDNAKMCSQRGSPRGSFG